MADRFPEERKYSDPRDDVQRPEVNLPDIHHVRII
jgi:hypothetical protein